MKKKMLLLFCALASALAVCNGMVEASLARTCMNETKIDGKTPDGELAALVDQVTMIDTIDERGNRLYVHAGTRLAGTRVGIHMHEYGGHTCVLSGTITMYMEGHEPQTFGPDTCYYMPTGTLMAAANLGSENVRLIDTFNLPPGKPPITICEPGYEP